MALPAATVIEVRTTGADTNGGGFVTGGSGTNHSLQDAAQYSVTDGVTDGTTTITSATANFGTDVVGNLIYVAGGTGTLTGVWRHITARTNATTITVEASTGLGASTGCTLKIGGALASPGQACAIAVAGNQIWLKSGTYTITSTSNNVSGGRFTVPGSTSTLTGMLRGYGSTRNDYGTKPVVIADGVITTFTICTSAFVNWIENVEFNGNSRTGSTGVACSTNSTVLYRCNVKNCVTAGVTGGTQNTCVACYFSGCAGPACGTNARWCVATGNTGTPFVVPGSGGVATNCIAYANTGANTDGFNASGPSSSVVNSVAYGNGRDGVRLISNAGNFAINCIAYGNTGNGFHTATTYQHPAIVNCAAGGNGTNFNASVSSLAIGSITLTGDPFTNAAGGDFSLNNTAGAGADLRATGFPGAFPTISTTGYQDIGAVQHADPAAAGGGRVQTLNRGLA